MTQEEIMAHYQLGYSLDQEGNKAEAEVHYDIVIDQATTAPELRYKAYKAKLYLNFDDVEKRNELSAIMTDIFSREEALVEGLYYDLSQYYKMIGDTDRLINSLEQLIARFPKSRYMTDSLLELALAYQHIKEDIGLAVTTFIDYFNRAGKKHPGVKVAAINLAECYNAMGQPAEAKAVLKRHLKME